MWEMLRFDVGHTSMTATPSLADIVSSPTELVLIGVSAGMILVSLILTMIR